MILQKIPLRKPQRGCLRYEYRNRAPSGEDSRIVDTQEHIPVLCKEIIEYLNPKAGDYAIDCTVGCAGHAKEILKGISPGGFLIGIDLDEEALKISEENLKGFENNFMLINDNFKNIPDAVKRANFNTGVDAILFDLGFSSMQINSADRGFSFNSEGPLDMRFDRKAKITAFDVVNKSKECEIEEIIRMFGEERFSKRIAKRIVSARERQRISTTLQLADIIRRAVPFYKRIHPATRTFQALRIFVNSELDNLKSALNDAIDLLRPGGKICVISFHSLEDRIVKHTFIHYSREHVLNIITKRPIRPSMEEINLNPRSRSAKLRVAQKSAEEINI